MPEITMSAVRLLKVKGFLQSSALKTSPVEMERWVSMADWGTPFSVSRVVSLDGVRATGGESAGGLIGGERAGVGAYEQCNHSQL